MLETMKIEGSHELRGRICASKHRKSVDPNCSMLLLSISPDHTSFSHSYKEKDDIKKITADKDIK